jgi:hypothetical protein
MVATVSTVADTLMQPRAVSCLFDVEEGKLVLYWVACSCLQRKLVESSGGKKEMENEVRLCR